MAVIYDYIVVGSGMTGAHAAQTLVESGCNTLMLDVGFQENHYSKLVPNSDFISIRIEDESQHRYFLGDNFEGIPWDKDRYHLTPPRQFIAKDVDKWLPFESQTFYPVESLSYGGLGSGWGAGCAVYPSWELTEMGLNPSEIKDAYEVIARRIGVSAVEDDATPYCSSGLKNSMEAFKMDNSISKLYESYLKHRQRLNAQGFFLGRTPMAVLTQDRMERKKIQYKDMEFWTDQDMSVYRSWMTVDFLRTQPNFLYQKNCLVIKFEEKEGHVRVHVIRVDTNEKDVFYCRKLILASGTLSTARIVLRSFPNTVKLPVITNPTSIAACLHWRMLGIPLDRYKTSLGQLELFLDENQNFKDVRLASFFTYRSLLLFKLVKEIPLGMADALSFMQEICSSIVLAMINHPDRPSESKYIELTENDSSLTGDHMRIFYDLNEQEKNNNIRCEKKLLRAFRKLGCYPLKLQQMRLGSSIHYSGTLPFNDDDQQYTISSQGKLNGTCNVYIADGSGFRYLPANGLTFTLMANAHLVAKRIIHNK